MTATPYRYSGVDGRRTLELRVAPDGLWIAVTHGTDTVADMIVPWSVLPELITDCQGIDAIYTNTNWVLGLLNEVDE